MNKTTAGFGQKLLACFLALAMALSLLPATALAADETQEEPPEPTSYSSDMYGWFRSVIPTRKKAI